MDVYLIVFEIMYKCRK